MNRKFLVCVVPMSLGFITGGCTSDPYAPVNQTTPIRQMDDAFDPAGSRYYHGAAAPAAPYDRTAPVDDPRAGYASPSYSRY